MSWSPSLHGCLSGSQNEYVIQAKTDKSSTKTKSALKLDNTATLNYIHEYIKNTHETNGRAHTKVTDKYGCTIGNTLYSGMLSGSI